MSRAPERRNQQKIATAYQKTWLILSMGGFLGWLWIDALLTILARTGVI